MPKIARKHQLAQSLLYHIYNRSNARKIIFCDDFDYNNFAQRMRAYAVKHRFKVYHWVIMPTHYHMLLEIDAPERISSIMAGLARSYVHYYHKKYGTVGYLWQGRFKSQPIEKEPYLLACGRYIERNPVRAKMLAHAEDYPYSSAGHYVFGANDGITCEDPLFSAFGDDLPARRREYREFIRAFNPDEETLFKKLEYPVGSRYFLARLVRENRLWLPRRRGRVRAELIYKNINHK